MRSLLFKILVHILWPFANFTARVGGWQRAEITFDMGTKKLGD